MKRFAFWLYQLYAWLIYIPLGLLLTFITGWLTVLVSILWSPRVAGRSIVANWGRVMCWLTPVFVSVEGAANADPECSYVVVSNHQSEFDIFVVYGWLKLDLRWVLKAELRKVPGLGIGCEKVGHIFVERNNPEQAYRAVSEALEQVDDGVGILFFAEGTRSTDGRIKTFKKGAFRTAVEQNLAVLPITIVGTHAIQAPKSMMIFPGRVRLVIHPPIKAGGVKTQDMLELRQRTKEIIRSALPAEYQQ